MKRAFIYGDLLFETIRVENGAIGNAELHVKRLNIGFALLQMDAIMTVDTFAGMVNTGLNGKKDARVRLTAYRNANGFYLPDSNDVAYDIHVSDLPERGHVCEVIGIYNEFSKSCHSLSNLKSGNALISVMAAKYAHQQGWSDAAIVNEKGNICEASGSNIFMVKGSSVFTPPLSSGCVMGVQRTALMETACAPGNVLDKAGFILVEKEITQDELLDADEIFLTNAISGIVPVHRVAGRKLSNTVTELLAQTHS